MDMDTFTDTEITRIANAVYRTHVASNTPLTYGDCRHLAVVAAEEAATILGETAEEADRPGDHIAINTDGTAWRVDGWKAHAIVAGFVLSLVLVGVFIGALVS